MPYFLHVLIIKTRSTEYFYGFSSPFLRYPAFQNVTNSEHAYKCRYIASINTPLTLWHDRSTKYGSSVLK